MKRICLSIFLAVLLSLSLSVCAAAANEQENNNTIDAANAIRVNENIIGFIEEPLDQDWYKVTVPSRAPRYRDPLLWILMKLKIIKSKR